MGRYKKGTKSYLIPVKYCLPAGSFDESGEEYLDMRASLQIFVDSSDVENAKHNQFSTFIELIQSELKSFNPNLPDEVAEALAIDGLFSDLSNEIKVINDNDRDTRKNRSKGTACE